MSKNVGLWLALYLALVVTTSISRAAEDGSDYMGQNIQDYKARQQDHERRISELENQLTKEKTERKTLEEKITESPQAEPSPTDMHVYWKEGLHFDSQDGKFKIKLGGRIQNDWGWISGSELEDDLGISLKDGIEFRRLYLDIGGDFYEDLAFKMQFDFAGGSAKVKDAYLRVKNLPVIGNVTIGYFIEPFSLEALTSDNYSTFMERALPYVLVPDRNVGVQASNNAFDQHMTWAVGMFRDTDDFGSIHVDSGYNFTTRLTFLPWYDKESKGARLLHLGGSYRLGHPDGNFKYEQWPEAHFTEKLTQTGNIRAEWVYRLGAEAALVLGPFSLQGEYIATIINDHNLGSENIILDGWYVQASYFLTGEHRNYKQSEGIFDRVSPNKNFRQDGGWGAWEVAARYSALDFQDDLLPASARDLDDITVGLNWYLNQNVRLMWNYIHSMVDGRDTDSAVDIGMMRIQVDF